MFATDTWYPSFTEFQTPVSTRPVTHAPWTSTMFFTGLSRSHAKLIRTTLPPRR